MSTVQTDAQRSTILIVDDDEGVTQTFARMLTLEGFQVEEIIRTGKFTPPPPTPDVTPPTGAQAATPLPEVIKPLPPKINPGLGTPAPATA